MNKYQKIAAKMAKDDLKKSHCENLRFRTLRNIYYRAFKAKNWTISNAINYKNWNKSYWF